MNSSCFKLILISLAAGAALSLFGLPYTIAQDITCTLSGRVVDVDGNPIAGLPIAVQSIEISNDELWPMYTLDQIYTPERVEHLLAAHAALPKSLTDEAGQFTITGIKPGPHSILGTTGRTAG